MKRDMPRSQRKDRDANERWNGSQGSTDDVYHNSESAHCDNPAPHSNRFDHDPMVIGLRDTSGIPRHIDGSIDNARWVAESNAGWDWRGGKWEPPK
jgi:hypothetical protein